MTSRIPQVDRILRHPRLVELLTGIRRDILAELVRIELGKLRDALSRGQKVPEIDGIAELIARRANELTCPALNRVINATGILLNTNLGRAPLAQSALSHLSDVGSGYCNLEFDLASGKRGERSGRIEELLRLLTGCDAALVVNNDAAAVLLAVNTLARGREVLVSRGELIEIGGSFRLPEVILAAGGILVEVGTTNCTRIADFERAITPETGLILKCRRSNFEIVGFTEEASLEELVELSRSKGIPMLEDNGSGALIDLSAAGAGEEPAVASQLRSGVDLLSFSGDKLLGGPQSGVLVGSRLLISRLHHNPLYRALRPDKLTLSALECVLLDYLSPAPQERVPVLRMACAPASALESRARSLADRANSTLTRMQCVPVSTDSALGGGTLPGATIPSHGIALESSIPAHELAARLRAAKPPVVAVVQERRVIIDLRTVNKDDEERVLEALVMVEKAAFDV